MFTRYIRGIHLLYSFTFAVVNLLEAIVLMGTLGLWSPMWVMDFCSWFAKETFHHPEWTKKGE